MASGKEFSMLVKIGGQLSGSFTSSFKGATNTLKALNTSMKDISTTQKNIGAFNSTGGKLEANKQKLSELTAEHKKLAAEMAATDKPSSKLTAALAKNESQIDKTNAAIIQETNKLQDLKGKLQAAGVDTSNLEGHNAKLTDSYNKLAKKQAELSKLSKAQAENNAAIKSTAGSLAKTVAVGAAGAAAAYKLALEPAAAFENQIAAVGAISGASDTDIKALANTAKSLGASTSFSASEVAKAMEYTSMAGWKTQQTISGLPGILNLAAASGEDLAAVSDIVTDALTAMNMKAEDSGRLSDILAAASSNANTNVGLMGESFKYCAATIGAMKYSAEDTSIALSLMANAGVKGSMSGTALKTALVNLAKPTKQMRGVMDNLHISLTNSDGSMKTLHEVMDNLRSSMSGLSADQQAAAAATIFGKEAMSGMLAVVNASEADYNKLTKAINESGGAAETMANKRLKSFNGQLTLARSALEGVQIAAGEALLPALTKLIQTVTPTIQKFAEWASQNTDLIANLALLAGALVATRAGFLTFKLGVLGVQKAMLAGQIAMKSYQASALLMKGGSLAAAQGFTPLTAGIGKVVAGVAGFAKTAALAAAPLLPWIAGIAAVAGALYLLYTHSETVRNAVDSFIFTVQNCAMQIWGTLGPALQQLADAVFPALQSAGETAGGALSTVFNFLWSVAQAVFPLIEAIVVGVFNNLSIQVQTLTGVLTGLVNFFQSVFTGDISAALEAVRSIFETVFNGIKNTVMNVINTIKNGIGGVASKAASLLHIGGGAGVPGYATGTKNTPNAFIAGENGPELIVGHPNATVFTAQQSAGIFAAMRKRQAPTLNASQGPELMTTGSAGGSITVNITSSPTINAGGQGVDFATQMQLYAKQLAKTIIAMIKEEQDRKGRLSYGI